MRDLAAPEDVRLPAGQLDRVRGPAHRAHAQILGSCPGSTDPPDHPVEPAICPLPENLHYARTGLDRRRPARQAAAQQLRAAPALTRVVLAVPEVLVVVTRPEDIYYSVG